MEMDVFPQTILQSQSLRSLLFKPAPILFLVMADQMAALRYGARGIAGSESATIAPCPQGVAPMSAPRSECRGYLPFTVQWCKVSDAKTFRPVMPQ